MTQIFEASERQQWLGGHDYEINFWREWFASGGSRWPREYRFRLDPQSLLQKAVWQWLPPYQEQISILDCGAGPLTYLGKVWPGHELQITAVDPLAPVYDTILDEAGIVPPVRTQWDEVETLRERFAENSFDLVHIKNALDHSYDPLRGIEQMLEVVKPGGFVLLHHFENEGETEGYSGMHQWNFCIERKRFIMWNKSARIDVTEALQGRAVVTANRRDIAVMTQIRKND